MPNRNYLKGVRKERKYVAIAHSNGWIGFRSAGSHSCIDVVMIDPKNKIIYLLQCKPDSMSQNAKNKILEENKDLQGSFTVTFQVV